MGQRPGILRGDQLRLDHRPVARRSTGLPAPRHRVPLWGHYRRSGSYRCDRVRPTEPHTPPSWMGRVFGIAALLYCPDRRCMVQSLTEGVPCIPAVPSPLPAQEEDDEPYPEVSVACGPALLERPRVRPASGTLDHLGGRRERDGYGDPGPEREGRPVRRRRGGTLGFPVQSAPPLPGYPLHRLCDRRTLRQRSYRRPRRPCEPDGGAIEVRDLLRPRRHPDTERRRHLLQLHEYRECRAGEAGNRLRRRFHGHRPRQRRDASLSYRRRPRYDPPPVCAGPRKRFVGDGK